MARGKRALRAPESAAGLGSEERRCRCFPHPGYPAAPQQLSASLFDPCSVTPVFEADAEGGGGPFLVFLLVLFLANLHSNLIYGEEIIWVTEKLELKYVMGPDKSQQ